jgi:predicted phosphodiesterase
MVFCGLRRPNDSRASTTSFTLAILAAPEVISELRKIAPITAIRGNIDTGAWASEYPHTVLVKLGGRSIYVLHNLKELDFDPASAGIDLVVSGHSHRPEVETVPKSGKRRTAPFHATHCTRDA